MAIHKLDDESYKSLFFDPTLWKNIDTSNISDLVCNLFPAITSITSKSENQDFSWFYGRVGIEGKGKIRVVYPYAELNESNFTLRNVCFSAFSFITLKAEGEKFKGWFDSQENLLEENEYLTISEDTYQDVTGFIAKFE